MEAQIEENQSTFIFHDDGFIRQYNITVGNVLKYFQLSNFYDTNSVNEKIEMQQRSIDQLEKIDGISFRLVFAEQLGGISLSGDDLKKPENQMIVIFPGMAIIDKVLRDKEIETLLSRYYILNGTISQAPDLSSILNVRLKSAMFHIRESMREVRNMFDWNLQTGFRKKVAADETETLYTFKESQIKDVTSEVYDEYNLQNSLLEELLKDIGITKS